MNESTLAQIHNCIPWMSHASQPLFENVQAILCNVNDVIVLALFCTIEYTYRNILLLGVLHKIENDVE